MKQEEAGKMVSVSECSHDSLSGRKVIIVERVKKQGPSTGGSRT